MDPITQFVAKYSPDIILPPREDTLVRLICQRFEFDAETLSQTDSTIHALILTHTASIEKWMELRSVCSKSTLDEVAVVVLKRYRIDWLGKENAFEKLLTHLFKQAINNPKVRPNEILALIEYKRSQQLGFVAAPRKIQASFENAVLKIAYVWNWSLPVINIRRNLRILPMPVAPILLNCMTYALTRWYIMPRCIETYAPRGINFLINHLPSKVFPLFFKAYDTAFYYDLAYSFAPNSLLGHFPRTARLMGIMAGVAFPFTILSKLPTFVANKTFGLSQTIVGGGVKALQYVEEQSEKRRFPKELEQVRVLWVKGK